MLCVEFPQAQDIDLDELTPVSKAVGIVTSEHFKLSTIFRSVTFWLLRCLLNGGETQFSGPRIQVTNTEIMWTFFGTKFCIS